MLERILLDTNMFIYLEDNHVLEPNVAKLTKILFDSSDYKIVIHPRTMDEANKIKNEELKLIFTSKISVYKQIENAPNAPEEFHNIVGYKNENDRIDNDLLYAVKQNCVSYLVTNDSGLQKKSEKIGLKNRVFSIQEAINKFKEQEEKNIFMPIFIEEEFLYQIQIEDSFFDSLREDYKDFDNWFKHKQEQHKRAFVTKNKNNKVTSFLMFKLEDKDEKYNEFDKPFTPAKRLKIATFKVSETGKRIGETFIKIIVEVAKTEKVDEIYITVFPKHNFLIELLEQYGFKYYTHQNTENSKGSIKKEHIWVKDMKNKNYYPYVKYENQSIFIIPIQPDYHKLLFPEAIQEFQIGINDYEGKNTASNAIKKAYISNTNMKKMKPKDILLFYASQDRKAITSLGIVDDVFNEFENVEELSNLVRKRTAYTEDELKDKVRTDSLVIMFKHYMCFSEDIDYSYLKENDIVNGYIQCPIEITKEGFMKIINKNNEDRSLFEI